MVDVVSLPKAEVETKPRFFPDLPTAEDINCILRVCHEQGELGLILGGSGIGKSATFRHRKAKNRGVHLITISPSTSELVPFLAHTAGMIGAYTQNTGAFAHREAIVGMLNHGWDPKLLIFDEVQHAADRSLWEALSIRDETGVGMVFAGNPSLSDRWSSTSPSRRAFWAQFLSRIGPTLHRPAPLPEDVDKLCDHLGNITAAARKLLKNHVLGPGGLRDVSKLVEIGGKAAKGRPIKPCHIEDAMHVRGPRP